MRHQKQTIRNLSFSEAGMYKPGSPNQVARHATGLMLFSGVGVAAESCVIGGVTYTFAADPTIVDSTDTSVIVDVAASAAAQVIALVAAINATGASATTYASKANGDNIKPNQQVCASVGFHTAAGDTVVCIARKNGVAGNAIVFTEGGTNTANYQLDGSTVATTLTTGMGGNNLLDEGNYTNLSLFNTDPELAQAEAGGAAADTINTCNAFALKQTQFMQYNATAQTILVPVGHANGLSIAGDQVNAEIVEFHAGYSTYSKHSYIPARDGDLILRAVLNIPDVSGATALLVGWRGRTLDNIASEILGRPAYDDYNELIAFNVMAGDIKGTLIKNGAATDTDDLADNWADAATKELTVKVSKYGDVTLLINGAAVTTAHTGDLKFDANAIIIPFIHIVQSADLTPVYLHEFECGQRPLVQER